MFLYTLFVNSFKPALPGENWPLGFVYKYARTTGAHQHSSVSLVFASETENFPLWSEDWCNNAVMLIRNQNADGIPVGQWCLKVFFHRNLLFSTKEDKLLKNVDVLQSMTPSVSNMPNTSMRTVLIAGECFTEDNAVSRGHLTNCLQPLKSMRNFVIFSL